ncbi:pyruvate dehydrogenase (acetyl-transferring) E1 component subunit alpha [Aeromicrobium panaciterrae]|uniref:thiamine pyrophosphate-dependent enzyme n=1 Tax=Aeromicrobium panaciterrae TaxID=363861 RepID=UPI0031D885B0
MSETHRSNLEKWLPNETDREGQPMFQMLAPDGSLTTAGKSIGVDSDLVRGLYRDMVLARRFDREALSLQRQGELSLWLMSWGQEAAQVGSIRALRDSDMVFPSYREHAAALCRGVRPADLMRQWRGLAHSGWNPADHRFHIYSLVLGTQTLHATGYATGAVLEGSDEVVATYFGDGAASQGDVNEAFNWAAAGRLPVLFFCQNNQWAISTPTSTQMQTPLHVRAAGFGLEPYHVDGNDVLAVHTITGLAASRIRDGGGPAMIEAQTYRFGGHSSSDDPKRYRSEEEFDLWTARDPLARVEVFLRTSVVDDSFFAGLELEADELAVSTREACKQLTGQTLAEIFGNVYAEPHPLIERERTANAAFTALVGGDL